MLRGKAQLSKLECLEELCLSNIKLRRSREQLGALAAARPHGLHAILEGLPAQPAEWDIVRGVMSFLQAAQAERAAQRREEQQEAAEMAGAAEDAAPACPRTPAPATAPARPSPVRQRVTRGMCGSCSNQQSAANS